MMLAIFGPNLRLPGEAFHTHAATCRDIARQPAYRGNLLGKFDPEDVPGSANESVAETVAGYVYGDMIEDGEDLLPYTSDIKFFPCCGDVRCRP